METRAAGENWKEKAVGSGRNARSRLNHNMVVRRKEEWAGRVMCGERTVRCEVTEQG